MSEQEQRGRRLADRMGEVENGLTALTKEVKAMREELKPIVQIYQGTKFSGRVLVGLLKFVLLVSGVVAALWGAVKWTRPA